MVFNKIWDNYKDYLLNFIQSKVDDIDVGYDILQDVGIKLNENLNKKVEINNYKAWLFQVTRNTIADYYRKHKKYSAMPIDLVESTVDSGACVCDLSGFIIETYLPEKYGRPLYLSDIEQRPQQEIAEILGISISATKSRILRARKKLKELINTCIDISYNNNGQIVDFQLKNNCELPNELKNEMEKMNLFL